jgi:hypothetical protein
MNHTVGHLQGSNELRDIVTRAPIVAEHDDGWVLTLQNVLKCATLLVVAGGPHARLRDVLWRVRDVGKGVGSVVRIDGRCVLCVLSRGERCSVWYARDDRHECSVLVVMMSGVIQLCSV